jgi:hypothetical protein
MIVSSDPIGLARWAIVSQNEELMEIVSLVLTLWISGSMILSVVWLLSLE